MKWLLFVLAFLALQAPAWCLDREAFTFTNYNLDVRIEPDQQRLGVRGKITLRNDSDSPQKNICLQVSSSLNWKSIKSGDKPVEFISQPYTSDIDHTGGLSEAIVTLPQPVPPNGTATLEVGYEGIVPLDATRLASLGMKKKIAEHADWDEIGNSFSAMRGIGYVTWYPVATEAADLSQGNSVFETIARWKRREEHALLEIKVHFLRDNSEELPTLLCSGRETNQIGEEADGAHLLSADCSFSPIGLGVPSLAIGKYSALERQGIAIYYLPEHKSAAENYALAAELVSPFVTDWFGTIREKAQVIELADAEASPFESGHILFTSLTTNDSTKYELAAVHQLTHAAFPSERPWIYEGLAHFAQAADVETKSGRQAALDFMGPHRAAIATAEKAVTENHDSNRAAAESLINTTTEEFYRSKAMYAWWMLRDIIGEKALKRSLAGYDPDQDKDPSYMPRLIETQTNRDLEWFFDDWVYRDHGLPDFRVESAYPRKLVGGGYMVTVTVENLGNAGAEVPLLLRMQSGEVRKRLEVHAKSKASIRIEASSTPEEITINDGSVPESDMSNNSYKIVLPAS
jgi:hypothetical protein